MPLRIHQKTVTRQQRTLTCNTLTGNTLTGNTLVGLLDDQLVVDFSHTGFHRDQASQLVFTGFAADRTIENCHPIGQLNVDRVFPVIGQ